MNKTPTRHPWTKQELTLLGKVPDATLAKQIGLSTGTVLQKRRSLGIEPSRPQSSFIWGKKEIALLGKFADQEVAKQLGLNQRKVLKKRLRLGIECYARTSSLWRQWTDKETALLGKMKDTDLAKMLGINSPAVTAKRNALHIASVSQNRPFKRSQDWTKKETALLGTMPDKQVAERLNLGCGTVRQMRVALGIPPCGHKLTSGNLWSPTTIARLGKTTDREISKALGVSHQRVAQKRKALGIPPFQVRK